MFPPKEPTTRVSPLSGMEPRSNSQALTEVPSPNDGYKDSFNLEQRLDSMTFHKSELSIPDRPLGHSLFEDDELTSQSADPLGNVIDWLAHADLGVYDADGFYSHEDSSRIDHWVSAAGDTPLFMTRRQNKSSSYCGLIDADTALPPGVDPEDEEWDLRQRQTGAAGRLVAYELGDEPMNDLHLRGGGKRRVMVAAVRRGGKAEQAGVKSGDVLVSISGKKDFAGLPIQEVQERLQAPVVLVFLGFVGKLQAEVRLNCKDHSCGLPAQEQVAVGLPEAPVKVVDEVVFQPSAASLFLTTFPPSQKQTLSRSWMGSVGLSVGDDGEVEDLDMVEDFHEASGSLEEKIDVVKTPLRGPADSPSPQDTSSTLPAVYELRGSEARHLVIRALSRATTSPFEPMMRLGRSSDPLSPAKQDRGHDPPHFVTRVSRFSSRAQDTPDVCDEPISWWDIRCGH